MTTITTQYSLWFLPICILTGFIYAWILYRKDKKFKEVSHLLVSLMFLLRFLSVGIISFLLLSPFVKNFGKTIEKPIIIYLQDNSESVLRDKTRITEFSDELKSFFKSNNDYIFKTYAFGENTEETDSFKFEDRETDIAQAISEIKNRYYNQNIGAVILASDGIYNKGNNPVYEVQNLNFPVYSVTLGDTSIRKDLIMDEIKYNKVNFINSKFPLTVSVTANKLTGKYTDIKIYDDTKLIYNQRIKINSDNYYKTFNLKIPAGKTGFHKLKITLSKIKDEVTYKNNSKQIIIEVSDKKQKILILSGAPHPDIAAISEALKLNRNFETDYFSVDKFNKSVSLYNLIILNQLPSVFISADNILNQVMKSDIPVIFMLGTQSDLNKFDRLNTGLTTGAYSNAPDEVTGKLNTKFNLFDINSEIETITLNSPPIVSAFGDYKLSGFSQILFYRQIKNINTQLPLIAFLNGNKKTAFITGEGIWRWRIYDYKLNQNHYLFNELINSIVQYLISKENKNRFNLISERIIPENQNVIFKAETYDKNFQLTKVDNINFQLTDSAKNISNFKFKRYGNAYRLNLKKLAAGDYKYKAETVIEGKKYRQNGIFSVVPVNAEYAVTQANHELLFKIAKHTGGKMYSPEEEKKLLTEISKNENIKPVSYREKKNEPLINFKLIFFIILVLLSSEWFMRKYFGAN